MEIVNMETTNVNCNYSVTHYKYRYTLGKDRELTTDGKFKIVVYHNGNRMEIENREVEFYAPVNNEGNAKILTMDEFKEIVKGTKGITTVRGEFKIS